MPHQDPYIAQELLSHQSFLRRLAIDLVGEDADDLVQDVWQRALERPPHHGRQLRGWLARVARNLAANRWRDEARRTEREEGRASARPAEEELEARFELRKVMVEALDCLSRPYRETILLRYFEGLAPRDIAKRQGDPVATVKTRLRRGLAQLREALDKRHGGNRATWMAAVTALGVPVGGGGGNGTLVIGGLVMGTMMKVSAAALAVAAGMYCLARPPQVEPLRMVAPEPPTADVELVNAEGLTSSADPADDKLTGTGLRNPIANVPSGEAHAALGTNVLRVILEGITDEGAREARVTVTGVDHRRMWPPEIRESWPCQGSTSELDLDPFLARVAERPDLPTDELRIQVTHPQHLTETTTVPWSSGVTAPSGQTVYEVRLGLVDVVYWPEFTLAVRDARTRAHLEDVELRSIPTAFMGSGQTPQVGAPVTQLGSGLSSPITLLGGRGENKPEDRVACLAVAPAAGETPRFAELAQPEETSRGVVVYARAPGHAWGRIVLDVSTAAESEIMLEPAAALEVRFENVQLERYAALEKHATLSLVQPDPRGGADLVWAQGLDESLAIEGVRLDALEPGDLDVSVELGGGAWRTSTVLAREELSLAAGETRELLLELSDAPAPPARATLGGVVSFPEFGGEEGVRLQLYASDYEFGPADFELSLADMERAGGSLPSWSFRFEDLPVDLYRVELRPFMTTWKIELQARGREDVELLIPELAEVLVESVDARTGERIPLRRIRHGNPEVPARQRGFLEATVEFEGEPGRFRFWAAPGPAYVRTYGLPAESGYGMRIESLELVPGLQSVRLELTPVCAIRFEFRDGGVALPYDHAVYYDVLHKISAVDHEGEVIPLSAGYVQLSAAGLYEVDFDGVGADSFLPIATRRVEVSAGETAEVIVDLRRR